MGKVNRNLASHGPGRTHPRANALAVRTGAMMRSVLQFVADRAAHGAAHDKQDRNHEGVRRGFKCRWFHSHPPYAVEDMLSKSHVQGQRRAENTERSQDTGSSQDTAGSRDTGCSQDTARSPLAGVHKRGAHYSSRRGPRRRAQTEDTGRSTTRARSQT
jgi:hypothetical protein